MNQFSKKAGNQPEIKKESGRQKDSQSRITNTLLIIIILGIFITASTAFFPWREKKPINTRAAVIVMRLPQNAQPTPMPEEIMKNREQTNGIVFGGVILVLIIVGGTLSVIGRKKPKG